MSEEPRNAGKQQVEAHTENTTKKHELTKRNADFMYRLRKEIKNSKLNDQQRSEALIDTETRLLEAQKTGTTAKQLFGTPTQRLNDLVEGPKKAQVAAQQSNMWIRALDNGLIFAALFSAMYAIMMLIEPKAIQASPGPSGILAIILTSLVGGIGMGYIYKVMGPDQKKRPSMWKQAGLTVAAVVLWIAFYMSFASLPSSINPTLPFIGYAILAVAAFGGRWYLRRKFHITGGIF
jgi:uncharacterized membrane-anchored protein